MQECNAMWRVTAILDRFSSFHQLFIAAIFWRALLGRRRKAPLQFSNCFIRYSTVVRVGFVHCALHYNIETILILYNQRFIDCNGNYRAFSLLSRGPKSSRLSVTDHSLHDNIRSWSQPGKTERHQV
jgi:hypothetical protein